MIAALIVWFTLEAPLAAPELPQVAREHNDRGVALVTAGETLAGIAELEQAYAAMPDPLLYRSSRGMVVGSLRSALMRHHAATGAPVHLCRLREILQRHRTGLLAALGPNGRPEDVAGTDAAIRDVDAKLAGHACGEATSPPGPPEPAPPEPPRPEPPRPLVSPSAPPPLHPPGEDSAGARRLRRTGGALLGLGGAAVLGTAIASGFYGDRYRRLDALDRLLENQAEVAEKERRAGAARVARTAAIVTGTLAAALIAAGVAVLVKSRRNGHVSALPAVTPTAYGFSIEGRF